MQVTRPAGEGSLWQVSPNDVCTRGGQARTGRTDVSHDTYAPTADTAGPIHARTSHARAVTDGQQPSGHQRGV